MRLPLRVLIVDDELQSRSLIRKLLCDHYPDFVIEEAESISVAAEKVHQFDPQMLFLDIQMRGETGFDLLDKIPQINCAIIFTTAHSEFAVKAFRYSAVDYLMKPLDPDDFKVSVNKVLGRMKGTLGDVGQIEYLKKLTSSQGLPDKLTVPTSEGFLFVNIKDIVYCEALSNYTQFHFVSGQKIISSHTLGYYNDLLEEQNFFRVHRSFLINLSFIRMYKKSDGGVVVMNTGDEIEVSRSNKEAFLKLIKL